MTKKELITLLQPVVNAHKENHQAGFGEPFYQICEAFDIDPEEVIIELFPEGFNKIKLEIGNNE